MGQRYSLIKKGPVRLKKVTGLDHKYLMPDDYLWGWNKEKKGKRKKKHLLAIYNWPTIKFSIIRFYFW